MSELQVRTHAISFDLSGCSCETHTQPPQIRGRGTTHELHACSTFTREGRFSGCYYSGLDTTGLGMEVVTPPPSSTPQHDGSVDSWVPKTSPWRPSRSQMTKNASRPPLVSQTSFPPYSRVSGLYRNALETNPRMSRHKVSALPISRSASWTSPSQRAE